MTSQPASQALASLAESFDAPLVVVTTVSNGNRAGCVVGFHTQCSIDPLRYAVWLSKANYTHRVALFATHFAVHVLDVADGEILELFGGNSGDEIDKFARCAWEPGPFDVPLLVRCPNRVVLERTTLWDDGGDHVCMVGYPLDASSAAPFTPMRLSAAQHVQPGHEAEERASPRSLTAEPVGSQPEERDVEERTHRLEDLAAGAGHPVDLSGGDHRAR